MSAVHHDPDSNVVERCKRLVIRNLPFDMTEEDLIQELRQRKSCAPYFESVPPRAVLTSFLKGKHPSPQKERTAVCATAFFTTEDILVAQAVAAALDGIALRPQTDPNLLVSVEYAPYQDAAVAPTAKVSQALLAGSIFLDEDYLRFTGQTIEHHGDVASAQKTDLSGATVVAAKGTAALEQWVLAQKEHEEQRKNTALVQALLGKWYRNIPFSWERRAKQASGGSGAQEDYQNGGGGSAKVAKNKKSKTDEAKSRKDQQGAKKDFQSKKTKGVEGYGGGKPVRDKERGKSSKKQAPPYAAGQPQRNEEVDKKHKKRAERESKRKRRDSTDYPSDNVGRKSDYRDRGEAAPAANASGAGSSHNSRRKSRRGNQSEVHESPPSYDAPLPRSHQSRPFNDAPKSVPASRKHQQHSVGAQSSSTPVDLKREEERLNHDGDERRRHRDRRKPKSSSSAEGSSQSNNATHQPQAPRTKEDEILARQREKEEKKLRAIDRDQRRRRQMEVVKEANQQRRKEGSSTTNSTEQQQQQQASSGRLPPSQAAAAAAGASSSGGIPPPRSNTFTVSNARRPQHQHADPNQGEDVRRPPPPKLAILKRQTES